LVLQEKQNPVLPRSMLDHEPSFIIEFGFKIQYFLNLKPHAKQTFPSLKENNYYLANAG